MTMMMMMFFAYAGLFLCLFLCPLTGLRETLSSDYHETLYYHGLLPSEESIKETGFLL